MNTGRFSPSATLVRYFRLRREWLWPLAATMVLGGLLLYGLAIDWGDSSEATARRLIKKLGSDRFPVRERACWELRGLLKKHPKVLPILQEATTDKDLEIALRAKQIVRDCYEWVARGLLGELPRWPYIDLAPKSLLRGKQRGIYLRRAAGELGGGMDSPFGAYRLAMHLYVVDLVKQRKEAVAKKLLLQTWDNELIWIRREGARFKIKLPRGWEYPKYRPRIYK